MYPSKFDVLLVYWTFSLPYIGTAFDTMLVGTNEFFVFPNHSSLLLSDTVLFSHLYHAFIALTIILIK